MSTFDLRQFRHDAGKLNRRATTLDPDANLKEQADLIAEAGRNGAWSQAGGVRLAQLRRALYDWTNAGGFAPQHHNHPFAWTEYLRWMRRISDGNR